MYTPVPSSEVIQTILHLRELFRRRSRLTDDDQRAFERREAATKDFLSNLPRIDEQPTLRTLLEIAEIYSLTLEGAHRLFGYSLPELSDWDLALNQSRTHILESYAFDRDLPVDLPARLASRESFTRNSTLRDLVVEWHTDIPLRVLDEEGWEDSGAFYVHVGTKDSLGSSVPPGATVRVEPITDAERTLPNPRYIYLLQFANGYRCSHCVVTRGKLRPFSTGRTYLGREEFAYPGAVRIAGRVRMFAMKLPQFDSPAPASLPHGLRGADLILPWEHPTRDRLLATKHRRFRRTKEEERFTREFLHELLQSRLSERTERRYRRPTASEPHVSSLLHLTLKHFAPYTDVLRTGNSWQSDRGRFSLDTLLHAVSLEESALSIRPNVHWPTPRDVWEARRSEFGAWPHLLSVKFPRLRQWQDKIVRLAHEPAITGLDPTLRPGTLLLLEDVTAFPDVRLEGTKSGWERPLYVLRRGMEIICGHLDWDGSVFSLRSRGESAHQTTFDEVDIARLGRVIGAAVPL